MAHKSCLRIGHTTLVVLYVWKPVSATELKKQKEEKKGYCDFSQFWIFLRIVSYKLAIVSYKVRIAWYKLIYIYHYIYIS